MFEPPERLRKAIICGNLGITKRLLARFPELWLNVDSGHNGWCNLHYASFYGHYLICFHLVSVMNCLRKQTGDEAPVFCDIDLVTFDNLTVLHMPLLHHHSQTLHFLLQEFSGAKWLNYRGGPLSRTPLHYCCVSGFVDGLTLLLEFGADWTLPDSNGDTCLHLGFGYGNLKCIEALLKFVMTHFLQQNDYLVGENNTNTNKSVANSISSGQGPLWSRDTLQAHVYSIISKLENTPNSHGQSPLAFAASFDMEERYFVSKKDLVDKTLDNVLLSKANHSSWDVPSSVFELDPDKYSKIEFSSPGGTSLVNHEQFVSISHTSSALDLDEASIPTTENMPPCVVGAKAKLKENKVESRNLTISSSTHSWKGRRHSRSLPSPANSDHTVQAESISQASRPHRHFPILRVSPLMGCQASGSSTSAKAPGSPLQVEFTSAQTRRTSLASSARSPKKQGSETPLDYSRRSTESRPDTSTQNSYVNLPMHSSFSSIGHKSITESEQDSGQGLVQKDRMVVSKFPSLGHMKRKGSSDNLKRNFSTPSLFASTFRNSSETHTMNIRLSRRPSLSEVSCKLSPRKSLSSQLKTCDDSPKTRHVPSSSILESPDDFVNKSLITISRNDLSVSQTSLPTLRIRISHDLHRGSADEQSPSTNVKSINFASVREQ